MRYIKYIVLTLSLILTACVTPAPNLDGVTVITCVHKYDDSIVIRYAKGNITRFTTNDVVTFYILDINDNNVYLNIYEIENYICEESVL